MFLCIALPHDEHPGDGQGRHSRLQSKGGQCPSQLPESTRYQHREGQQGDVIRSGLSHGPKLASAQAGKEFLGQDSTLVDKATARVNVGAEKLQNKAVQAFDDAKGHGRDCVSVCQRCRTQCVQVST